MNSPKILIIGYGTVGTNLEIELQRLTPDIYDKYKMIDTRKDNVVYDVAFICVDTPISDTCLCDLTEIKNALINNNSTIFVIKSTILPGSTDMLIKETGKKIIFSPEYYGGTQHCSQSNFNFDFTILGGKKEYCIQVIQILQNVYNGSHKFSITDSKTAELVKYMENSFIATKVSFCNQFYNIAQDLDVSYEELRELFLLDPRVNPSHTFVYRDTPFWDSHCLNKDVSAIASAMNAPLLKSIIDFNNQQKLNAYRNNI